MKRHVLASDLGLLFWLNAHALAADQVKTVSFYELMNNTKLHSRQVVRVCAILEQSVLYANDCGPGKTSTAVEFDPRSKGATKKLDRLVAKSRRAWVVVEGVFYSTALSQPR